MMMKHLPPPWKQRLIRPLFRPHTKSPSSDQGLTLIEGLVAILIISAVTTAITPMMFLSVATRVQNRRAEQAVQLAHGQIDQVRVLIDQGLNSEEVIERQLPPLVPDVQSVRDVGPPTGAGNRILSTNSSCPNRLPDLGTLSGYQEAFPVDVSGDCETEFYVQIFRTNEVTAIRPDTGLPVPIVFRMGVRVYYRNARPNFGNLETEEASLIMTTGEGQQTRRPLAALYSVMAQGDTRLSLDRYRCFVDPDLPGCS
ncbi:MAG: type II secretion system GspH family protein [Phormidium sp. PBR-2020]|nr:MAG: type II secretion system GspH family protein [Phormidium sp. PBR-2020]